MQHRIQLRHVGEQLLRVERGKVPAAGDMPGKALPAKRPHEANILARRAVKTIDMPITSGRHCDTASASSSIC